MTKRRGKRSVVALFVLALVAISCSRSSDFEAGELGSVTVRPGEAIQIRSLQAISEPDSALGVPQDNAIRLAVEHYGLIAGHAVEVDTALDEFCSEEGGQTASDMIVAEAQVVGVIGTSCDAAAITAMPGISEAGMVMLSGSNTSPELTSDLAANPGSAHHAGYSRTAHNDLTQGVAAARFIAEHLGLSSAALIHDDDPKSRGLTEAFEMEFTQLGGIITSNSAVATGKTDMVPLLTDIAATKPEAIFMPLTMADATFIMQQVGSVAGLEDVVAVGANDLLTTDFLEQPESEGMYLVSPDLRVGDHRNGVTGKSAEDVLSDYQIAYDLDPTSPFWAHAYDATVILLRAIEAAGVVEDDVIHIDRQTLRDEILKSSLEGITGQLRCDEFGDCSSARMIVVLHRDSSAIDATLQNVVYSYVP